MRTPDWYSENNPTEESVPDDRPKSSFETKRDTPKVRIRPRLVVAAASVVIVLIGYVGWAWWTSPTRSLMQISNAVETHDIDLFNKYVDVEGATSLLLDHMLSLTSDRSQSSESEFGGVFAKGLLELAKPTLTEIVKRQVSNYVELGSFEGGVESEFSQTRKFSLQKIWSGINGTEPAHSISFVKREGKIAYVGLSLYLEKYDTSITLDMKMRDKGTYWQFTGFSNLQTFLSEFDDLERNRVKTINDPILKRFKSSVQVYDWRIEKVRGYFGIAERLEVSLDIRNQDPKAIEVLDVTLHIISAATDTVGSFSVFRQVPISPGEHAKFQWIRQPEAFSYEIYSYFHSSDSPVRQSLVLNRIKYEGEQDQTLERFNGLVAF